jgi:hypothetical protein
MEGLTGKEGCSYDGQHYMHGSEIFILRRCMICIDGKWQDKKLYGSFSPIS